VAAMDWARNPRLLIASGCVFMVFSLRL